MKSKWVAKLGLLFKVLIMMMSLQNNVILGTQGYLMYKDDQAAKYCPYNLSGLVILIKIFDPSTGIKNDDITAKHLKIRRLN